METNSIFYPGANGSRENLCLKSVESTSETNNQPSLTSIHLSSSSEEISQAANGELQMFSGKPKYGFRNKNLMNLQSCKSRTASKERIISPPPSDNATSTVSEGSICRICHEGESRDKLVSPCFCAGSVGRLHLQCLEKWLGSSNSTKCEICNYEYIVVRMPKPFREFLKSPGSPTEKRNLVCDIACFVILTPLTAASTWLCLVGIRYYAQWHGRWEVPGLACLIAFLLTVFFIWLLISWLATCFLTITTAWITCKIVDLYQVAFRYEYRVWTEWKETNQTIEIKCVTKPEVQQSCTPTTLSIGQNSNKNPCLHSSDGSLRPDNLCSALPVNVHSSVSNFQNGGSSQQEAIDIAIPVGCSHGLCVCHCMKKETTV